MEYITKAQFNVLKAELDDQVKNAAMQIRVLQNDINKLKAQPDSTIDIQATIDASINNLKTLMFQILADINAKQKQLVELAGQLLKTGEFSAGTITISLTEGDEWMGTKTISNFNSSTRLVYSIHSFNVVTRVPGEGTSFDFQITDRHSGSFDWVLSSYAKVFFGTVKVEYVVDIPNI